MSMFVLSKVIYELFHVYPFQKEMKRKKYHYFETLHTLRSMFVEYELDDPILDNTTALIYSYCQLIKLANTIR